MLNFRFHIVSLVAVFLALAIGIIMGSTVIDRALVDTLEDQQQSLRADLDTLSEENASLRGELGDLSDASERLADEGGERLLVGALADTPVLVIAVRGVDTSVLDELDGLFDVAGALDQGTLWLTGRFAVDDEDAMTELAELVGVRAGTAPEEVRSTALTEIAAAVRAATAGDDATGVEEDEAEPAAPDGTTGDAAVPEGSVTGTTDVAPVEPDGSPATSTTEAETETEADEVAGTLDLLVALRDAGFVEYDAPADAPDDIADLAVGGTRIVLVSGAGAEVSDAELAAPLATALVSRSDTAAPPVSLLVAEAVPDTDQESDEPVVESVVAIVRDGGAADFLSTVDNVDTFAGRLAAVLALQDLGEGRRGHYGVGPDAQRLLPAPEG